MKITVNLIDHCVVGCCPNGSEAGVRSTIAAEDWPLIHETVEQRDDAQLHGMYPGAVVEADWWTPTYTLTYDTEDLGYCE